MDNNILGIDIGATKTIFLAVRFLAGDKFEILEEYKCATPRSAKEILELLEAKAKEFIAKYDIYSVGIGFAGLVDFERGAALVGPNLGTGRIEFKKILEKNLADLPELKIKKITVAVDNDARCFILAESIFGAAKGHKNIVGLTIGTGIGAGIIIDGKIYRGANNFAGEIGHAEIGRDAEFEATASGGGLSKIYQKFTGKKISGFEIIDLANKGNANALDAINRVAKILGLGIASLIELLNPEIVILGGGLSEVGLIMDKAKEVAKKKIFLPSLAQTRIKKTKLGEIAPALGAAWLANSKYRN